MLLVIPVSLSDRHLISSIERAFEMHPPGSGHELLVVGSPNVFQEVKELAQKLCIHFAGNAKTHLFETDNALGWPTACNYYFQQCVFYIPSILPHEALWFWFELDCVPLRSGWLDEVENACIQVRAQAMRDHRELPKFFGVLEPTYQEFRGELQPPEVAGEHMAACGVYPSDMLSWVLTVNTISATNIPWYCFVQWYVLRAFHELPLVQNNWKTNSYERNAQGKLSCKSEANWAWDVHFNHDIRSEVVLVHGCKDGSLTELLAAEHELLKGDDGVQYYWTDFHEEAEPPQEDTATAVSSPERPKKRRFTKAQIDAARERLMKMHEARRAAAVK